jgi:hypothetical protein
MYFLQRKRVKSYSSKNRHSSREKSKLIPSFRYANVISYSIYLNGNEYELLEKDLIFKSGILY